MKLYRVTLRGVFGSNITMNYTVSYVIAEDSNLAYLKVKNYLDEKDYGFSKERELDKVELIADSKEYNDCLTMLFL